MGGEKLWKILCKPVGIFFEFSFCFVRLMLMKQLRDLKPLVKSLLLLSLRYTWKIKHKKVFCFWKFSFMLPYQQLIWHENCQGGNNNNNNNNRISKAAPRRGASLSTLYLTYFFIGNILFIYHFIFDWTVFSYVHSS